MTKKTSFSKEPSLNYKRRLNSSQNLASPCQPNSKISPRTIHAKYNRRLRKEQEY